MIFAEYFQQSEVDEAGFASAGTIILTDRRHRVRVSTATGFIGTSLKRFDSPLRETQTTAVDSTIFRGHFAAPRDVSQAVTDRHCLFFKMSVCKRVSDEPESDFLVGYLTLALSHAEGLVVTVAGANRWRTPQG
jgi:hypothetical protein